MKREMSKEKNAIAFWQYESTMMWSRVKTVALIEAGGLAGAYKVWGDGLTSLATGILMLDRKSTRLNSSHTDISRMPSSA